VGLREVKDSEWRVAAMPTAFRVHYGGFGLTRREMAEAAARASLDDLARQRGRLAAATSAGREPLAAAAAAGLRAADAARAAVGEAREQLEDREWLRALQERRPNPASPVRR
jgi:hypothetical protein